MIGPKSKDVIDAVVARLSKYMAAQNLTQYKLAKLSGVPFSTIKHIMQKKTRGVNLKTIIMLAHGLGVTPAQFIDDDLFLYENLDLDYNF